MNRFFTIPTFPFLLTVALTFSALQLFAAGVHGSEGHLPNAENRNSRQTRPSGEQGPDPFKPTVTREEAAFLAQVMTVAETNTVAAVTLLREGRPKDAESPVLDFTLGNLYFQQDNLREAEAAYWLAIEQMPRFRAALMNLGRVLLLQEKTWETVQVYQQLVEDGQADAEILLLLGHALLIEDAPISAETAYRQAILLRPRETEIRMGLAKALLRQERFREGLALIDEILKQEPLNRELWSLRVNALLSDEKHDLAIRAIEQARRLDRATPEMLATLGDLWLNRSQPEDALDAYTEAFALEDPSLDRMLRALKGFLLVDNSQGAQAMIKQISVALDPKQEPEASLQFLRLRAEFAMRQDNLDAARTLLNQVLAIDPLEGRALLNLSDLQHQQGKTAQALLTAERASRVEGFEAEALLQQARIEVERGRYRRAVPLLEAAQAFEPREAVARYLEQVRRLAR